MFTGIITELGRVTSCRPEAGVLRLEIEAPETVKGLEIGGSVAVSGPCQTAVEIGEERFTVQAVPETMARTTLGKLTVGDTVNLELPLRAGDPIGGHMVTGHVDQVSKVVDLRSVGGGAAMLTIRLEESIERYVAEKGSIAIDGVSLTVASVKEGAASVALVPHTMGHTTLPRLRRGDHVNVEVDIIARYLARLLPENAGGGSGINEEWLLEHGYGSA